MLNYKNRLTKNKNKSNKINNVKLKICKVKKCKNLKKNMPKNLKNILIKKKNQIINYCFNRFVLIKSQKD